MIPKVIHFVWLGGAPKPPIVLGCIESWKRACPGWEIREWGDESLAGLGNRYLREAVEHRKWAFAADYLRLRILNDHGGFYLDSDLELLKPIDEFRKYDFVTGFIDRPPNVLLNMCFLGAAKGNGRIAEMLDEYERISFVGPDGELDQTPNVVRFARYFASRGFDFSDAHAMVELSPTERICPVEWFNSREGYAFHHYAASWLDDWARKVWLRCGRWKLVRFKRRMEATSPAPALMKYEDAVFTLRLGSRKRVVLLRGPAAGPESSGRTDCEGCVFVTAVRDEGMYSRLVKRNPNNEGGEFVAFDNLADNLPVTKRYNSFLDGWDYTRKAWFVFVHEDYEFLEPLGPYLDRVDTRSIYGTVGARSTRPGDDALWALNSNRDGSSLGLYGRPISAPVTVLTSDCNCLIVHSDLVRDYGLRFDENLTFDLYAEDFEINAFERHGVRTKVIGVLNHHYSFGHIGRRFFEQRRYLMGKYSGASRLYGTTTKQLIGPMPLVLAARRANRRWRRRRWLRSIAHFFWYRKYSRDGYMRIRILGLRIKRRVEYAPALRRIRGA